MEYGEEYYNKKWEEVISKMPVGGQYRFDLRKYGYQIAVDAIPPKSKVFDYACGLGVIDQMLISKDCKVSGCDFSSVAVDYCKKKTGGDFRQTDKIFGGSYDVIIAAYFLEHIKDPLSWVKMALEKAPRVICHLPKNFSAHGEHIDMGWSSWPHFEKVFESVKFKRIDKVEGSEWKDLNDENSLYPKGLGQFAHPIIEFIGEEKVAKKKKKKTYKGK